MSDNDTSVFGTDQSSTKSTPEANTTPKEATLPEAVALLVGEGRKYRTLEDMAKGYVEADGFIEKLKGENAALRDQLKGASTIEDVMKRLEASQTSAQDRGEKTTQGGLSADAVAQIVRDQLTGLETERTKHSNLMKADALMKASFGDKAKEVFEKEASNPQMKAALMALASVSPEKFLAVFGGKAEPSQSATTGSTSVNTAALNVVSQSGRALDPGCKEYYDALRRKDSKAYYSAPVQLQMNRAAQTDRDKFFGS